MKYNDHPGEVGLNLIHKWRQVRELNGAEEGNEWQFWPTEEKATMKHEQALPDKAPR